MVVRVGRITEWILATVGAAVCISVAIIFWQNQLSSPSATLWPLPALVLIETALLGLAGMLAVVLDRDERTPRWGSLTWGVCGALAALTVIGGFSIGPLLFWAVLAFVLAAVLAGWRRGRKTLHSLGNFALGAVGNAALILLLIVVANASR